MINFIVLTEMESGKPCLFNVQHIANVKAGLTNDTSVVYTNLYSKLITTSVNESVDTIIEMLKQQK